MKELITVNTRLIDIPKLVSIGENGLPNIKLGTIQAYRLACLSLIKSGHHKEIRQSELTPLLIYNWHNWLKDQSLSIHTANSYRRSLKAMFRKIDREDLASPIEQQTPPRRRSKAISDEHLAKLLTHASLRDAAIIMFLRDSGVRRGAVCSLLSKNVRIWQSDNGDWRLAAEVFTKGEQTDLALAKHQCALAVNLWLSVRPVQDAKHLFTTDTGGPLNEQSLNSIFRTLRIKAKIPRDANIFPHALRHRFAHKMLSKFDAKIVSQLMGHSSVQTTLEIYGHRTQEELMDAYYGSDQS